MLPKGFLVGGIHSGIAKKKKKNDLAFFYSEFPAKASGMFTSNIVKAAPVLLSMAKLKRNSSDIRMIVANSGCANACTGQKGLDAAKKICGLAAEQAGIKESQVLNASTGVIGQHLPVGRISGSLETLFSSAGNSEKEEMSAVSAIMTTDTLPKISSRSVNINGKKVTIWGCAKGAGMIHPDLRKLHATMLSFILTDAAISVAALEKALNSAADKSFNCVTVDGDTSTNDTVFLFSNGAAGNAAISGKGHAFTIFSQALNGVCLDLAKMIAKDGEGATRLVEIEVKNARTAKDAKKIASTIATSPLVKTAVFGNDANWGRIMGALGRAGVRTDPYKVDIKIGSVMVSKNGTARDFSESLAKKELMKKEVKITVDLNSGRESARYYTCDFSFDYIKINASYRS